MFSPFASGLFSGILAGVLVAVFSQLLLQGIFEPARRLKGKIAEVGMQLGLLNNRYPSIDEDYVIMKYDIDLINRLSAEIHSLPYQILMYSKTRFLFCLPSHNDMKKVYCRLNQLSHVLGVLESMSNETQVKPPPKEDYKQSWIERRKRNIGYVKPLAEEIKKLLNIRQPNPPLPPPQKKPQAAR